MALPNLRPIQRRYFERLASTDAKALPHARVKFEPPLSILNQTFQLPGHGLLFCIHGKSYFEPCNASTCRRTKKEADQRLNSFLDAHTK